MSVCSQRIRICPYRLLDNTYTSRIIVKLGPAISRKNKISDLAQNVIGPTLRSSISDEEIIYVFNGLHIRTTLTAFLTHASVAVMHKFIYNLKISTSFII